MLGAVVNDPKRTRAALLCRNAASGVSVFLVPLPTSCCIQRYTWLKTPIALSDFAQSSEERRRRLVRQYVDPNRTRLNGGERFIKLAPQSAFARAAPAANRQSTIALLPKGALD